MMTRHLLLIAPLLWGCPSTGSQPHERSRREPPAPLPGGLVDTSAFVDGRVLGDELGWVFETGGRKSERVPWPTWMGEASCAKDLSGRLAWAIEGSERLLVLGDEPLIVERRVDCLAAVPVRRRVAELGKKTLEVGGDTPRMVLFESDPSLGTLALIASESDLPSLEWEGGVLEPVGTEHEQEDQLGCLGASEREKMMADDPELVVAPSRHTVSATWYGDRRAQVLEVFTEQSCDGDPSVQGGAVHYERDTRWVLEREGDGWRQVELEVRVHQSSSGDGAGISLQRRQGIQLRPLGAAVLVGRLAEFESSGSSHYGSSSESRSRADWWLVPRTLLVGGFDVLAFEEQGLRLTPPHDEPERVADLEHTSGTSSVGGCRLALLDTTAELICGENAQVLKLTDTAGKVTRRARMWDLGAVWFLRLELAHAHEWTEPPVDDDSSPVEHSAHQSESASLIVSKRRAAMLEVGGSASDFSM